MKNRQLQFALPANAVRAAIRTIAPFAVAILIGAVARIAPAAEPPSADHSSNWLGHPTGATAIEPIAAGAPLVGMDVWIGIRGYERTSPFITAIAPIYAGADRPNTGPYGLAQDHPIRILARPGYAVAGVAGLATDRILGFRLIFMRLQDGAFDPQDRYESRWIGGRGDSAKETQIAGDGKLIVGLLCRYGNFVNAVALAQDAKLLKPPALEAGRGPADPTRILSTETLVREVERRGGKAVRDPKDPAHPVVEIDFTDSQLGNADLAILDGQSSLKRLVLKNGYNKFSERGLAHLETLKNLEYLDIEHNFGQAVRLPLHLGGLTHLKSLGLAHSNDGNQAADAPILGTMSNLENLTISDAFTDESMEHLAKLVNLRLLYIDDTPITNTGAERLRSFRKLRSLTVFSSVISDEGYASLEDLHELEQLKLGGQELTAAVLKHVKAPNLKSLYLGGAGFDDRIVPFLQTMHELEDLHLGGTSLTDQGLAELSTLTHLVSLNLEQGSVTGAGLLKLTGLKQLKVLRLSGNPIQDSALASLRNFPALEVLDLTKTSLTAESLASLKEAPKLRELSLAGVRLNDGALSNLEPLVNLEMLLLPSTRINGAGLTHLKHLQKLKQLQLQLNPITDENASALGEMSSLQNLNLEKTLVGDATLDRLAKLPNLEVLAAPLTQITDRGVASLAAATKLRELNLSNPRLTDAAIAPILGLRELRVVALNFSQITDGGVERLAELPNLRTLYIGATHVGREPIQHMAAKSAKLKIFHNMPQFPDARR